MHALNKSSFLHGVGRKRVHFNLSLLTKKRKLILHGRANREMKIYTKFSKEKEKRPKKFSLP